MNSKRKQQYEQTLKNKTYRRVERNSVQKELKKTPLGQSVIEDVKNCSSRPRCKNFYCKKCYPVFLNKEIRAAKKAARGLKPHQVATFTILIGHIAFDPSLIDEAWGAFRKAVHSIFKHKISGGKLICWQELDHFDPDARASFYNPETVRSSKHYRFLEEINQLDVDQHHSVLIHAHGFLVAPNRNKAIYYLEKAFPHANQTKFKRKYTKSNVIENLSGWVRYSTKNSPRYYRKGKVHFGPFLRGPNLLNFIEYLNDRPPSSRRLKIGLNHIA